MNVIQSSLNKIFFIIIHVNKVFPLVFPCMVAREKNFNMIISCAGKHTFRA